MLRAGMGRQALATGMNEAVKHQADHGQGDHRPGDLGERLVVSEHLALRHLSEAGELHRQAGGKRTVAREFPFGGRRVISVKEGILRRR